MTTIRSSFTPDGQRVTLEEVDGGFRVSTRWNWVTPTIARYEDAAEAFDVIEFCEGDLRKVAREVLHEMRRVPRAARTGSPMQQIMMLLTNAEKRISGLRPRICGSKGSVVVWS